MANMIPVTKNREPREGEKWFYEFHEFMKQFPEIHKALNYRGFQFFDCAKDYRAPLYIGGVFQISGTPTITDEFVETLKNYSSSKIVTILYQKELKQYGKNCIVVLMR